MFNEASVVFVEYVTLSGVLLLLPWPLVMVMAPLATPNKVRTAASFNEIAAVADKPSSVLTALRLIAPDAGNAIDYSLRLLGF
jgi:hypothetical protein